MRSSPVTTDGWRGLPGIGYAEPQLLAALDQTATSGALGNRVLVAYDGRAGARELAHLAADLLASRGLTCYLTTGPTPTPAAGHLVHRQPHLHAAVIVTASHNPPGFLGIKLRDDLGHGLLWLPPEDNRAAPIDTLPPAPQPHLPVDALSAYSRTVGRTLTAAAQRFDGHVIVDAAHGCVGALAPHLPELGWHRSRPLPFFGGRTPDPVLRPQADDIAAAALDCTSQPHRTLIAMVDGDGDRLALYTARSGYVGSAEQAAALLDFGLPVQRLITTAVCPRATLHTAHQHHVQVELVPVGFKHIVAAWQKNTATPTLGLEPNGALTSSSNDEAYFERDSLAALSTLLTNLPTMQEFDDTIAELRRRNPHPQRIVTVPRTLAETLDRLGTLLSLWDTNTTQDGVVLFDGGTHEHVAVRASGTEPGTRLYIEAPSAMTDRIIGLLNTSE